MNEAGSFNAFFPAGSERLFNSAQQQYLSQQYPPCLTTQMLSTWTGEYASGPCSPDVSNRKLGAHVDYAISYSAAKEGKRGHQRS